MSAWNHQPARGNRMEPARYEQQVATESDFSFNSWVWVLPNLDVKVDTMRKHFLTRSHDNAIKKSTA